MALAVSKNKKESTGYLSEILGVPKNHLMKVVQELSRMGVIESSRGVSGGVCLKKSPEEISILEIFEALETAAVLECYKLESNTCPLQPVCKLKGIFKEAMVEFKAVLSNYTVKDLMQNEEEISFFLR